MTVTVYGKPSGCYQCDLTKKFLNEKGVPFIEENALDEANFEYITDLGHMQAPVVVVIDGDKIDHWSGFQPDRLKELVTEK